jgi:hypothetical protein
MGSFYSTCSVSNMTLSNQKTSVQLISPGYSTDFKGHMNMVVSNDGAQAFFSPFGFPIHGRYDDYGHITSIKRDKNVEMLEEFFGVTIDEILQNIGDDRSIPKNIKNEEIFRSLGMTYYRTEVLEYLQKGWDKINIVNPKPYSMGSRMVKLFNDLDKKPTKDNPRFQELISKAGKSEDESEELYEMMDLMSGSTIRENSYIASLAKTNMFKILPITIDFKEDILKQYKYLITLGYELSRLLIPSVYGSQETNWPAQYRLNDFVNDLLVEDMKENIEDVYDDEEDYYSDEREIIKDHFMIKRDKKLNNILG